MAVMENQLLMYNGKLRNPQKYCDIITGYHVQRHYPPHSSESYIICTYIHYFCLTVNGITQSG